MRQKERSVMDWSILWLFVHAPILTEAPPFACLFPFCNLYLIVEMKSDFIACSLLLLHLCMWHFLQQSWYLSHIIWVHYTAFVLTIHPQHSKWVVDQVFVQKSVWLDCPRSCPDLREVTVFVCSVYRRNRNLTWWRTNLTLFEMNMMKSMGAIIFQSNKLQGQYPSYAIIIPAL